MSGKWASSTRSSRLPRDWPKRRARILRRDRVCQHPGCTSKSAEVDHRINGDDHRDSNLQGLCTYHHRLKTQAEAQAAKPKRLRPTTQHPGFR